MVSSLLMIIPSVFIIKGTGYDTDKLMSHVFSHELV